MRISYPYAAFSAMLVVCFISSCSWQRIGNLTMVSTRNVESEKEYKLIKKNVEGKARTHQRDALQVAIDEAVKKLPEGEFMKNVTVYVKGNGKKIKVSGDVWGIPSVEKNITTSVVEDIVFKVGDNVVFKTKLGKLTEGKILGIHANYAIIEYITPSQKTQKIEMPFEKLTKIEKQE